MTAKKTNKSKKLKKVYIDLFCRAVAKGIPEERACKHATFSNTSFRNWMNEIEEKNIEPMGKDEVLGSRSGREKLLSYFAREYNSALLSFEEVHVANIEKHAVKVWVASAWLLERRFPHEWGKLERKEIEVSASKESSVQPGFEELVNELKERTKDDK